MAIWVNTRYGIVNIEPCDEIAHRPNEDGQTWSVIGRIRQGTSLHEHVLDDACEDEAAAQALLSLVFQTLGQGAGATLDLTTP